MSGSKTIDPKGTTQRIGNKFNAEIENIKDKRLRSGIDKKRRSTKQITDQLIKHADWEQMKEDTIEFKFKGEDDE